MNKILCLRGDGVGHELIDLSLAFMTKIKFNLDQEYKLDVVDFGGRAIDKYGHPFPQVVKDKLGDTDAILLGAIGHPKYDYAVIRPENGLLEIRSYLNLYANIRSLKVSEAMAKYSPLKAENITDTDMVIVRELIGGAYFGKKEKRDDYACDYMEYTSEQIDNILKYGFELAMTRKKELLMVDKANVLATSKLWRERFAMMEKDYPEVATNVMYIDAFAMELVKNPNKYDVVVCENLFGDIVTDELAAIGGSLGLLPSGSFSLEGPSLYEPAHGSAPTIAGFDLVNPIAMLLSITMMLRQQFNESFADTIEDTINIMLEEGYVTKDLNEKKYVTTSQFMNKLYEKLGV